MSKKVSKDLSKVNLDQLVAERFNGDRDEAIKMLAFELSSQKYIITLSVENCRQFVTQLSSEEKQKAHELFKQNEKANKRLARRLSRVKTTYERIQTAIPDTEAYHRNLLFFVAAWAALCFFLWVRHGIPPWYDLLSIIATLIASIAILHAIIAYHRAKSLIEYAENEDLLLGIKRERSDLNEGE